MYGKRENFGRRRELNHRGTEVAETEFEQDRVLRATSRFTSSHTRLTLYSLCLCGSICFYNSPKSKTDDNVCHVHQAAERYSQWIFTWAMVLVQMASSGSSKSTGTR